MGEATEIFSAEYSGAENGKVHLDYPLLPDIIANRIQNLFANENLVQRTMFFKDGMELFSKSPIIGRGLGGFENGVYSVQDFYYETKYAHNHYIQVLSDLGIVGFILFMSILVSSVASIIKAKENRVPFCDSYVISLYYPNIRTGFNRCSLVYWCLSWFSAAILALITVFCA